MLRSFFSGISGLRTHILAMDVVGNNIANVNTPGYKGGRVSFKDTLSQTLSGAKAGTSSLGGVNPQQIGLGMTIASIDTNFSQGSLQSTNVSTDLAIQGDGFFVVGSGSSFFYTRAGVFNVDNVFNFVSAQTGDLVYGWTDSDGDGIISATKDSLGWINLDRRGDGDITNILSSSTAPVQGANRGDTTLSNVSTTASTISDTWTITCSTNGPAGSGSFDVIGAKTGALTPPVATVGGTYSHAAIGSFDLLGPTQQQSSTVLANTGANYSMDITANDFGGGGNLITVELNASNINQNLSANVTGDTIVIYLETDGTGVVQTTPAQLEAYINNATSPTSGVITANITADDLTAVVESMTTTALTGGSGPANGDSFTFTTTAAGDATAVNISVNEKGTIIAVFDNGTTEEVAQVALARFSNPQGMTKIGETKFAESPNSGSGFPVVESGSGGTGTILSGFLEMSNVDLSQEFTSMIILERGFQANSRIITTGDEMIQELLALKR